MAKEIVAAIGMEVVHKKSEEKMVINHINDGDISARKIFKNVVVGSQSGFFTDFSGIKGEKIVTPDYAGSILIPEDSIYLIDPSSSTHSKLISIWERGKEVRHIAFNFISSLGGVGYIPANYFAGGVIAVKFIGGSPSREWSFYDKKNDLYMPHQKAWVLKQKINDLPKIENSEVNKIIGFPDFQTHTRNFVFRPEIERINDQFIIHIDAGLYLKVGTDKLKITKSKYYALKGE